MNNSVRKSVVASVVLSVIASCIPTGVLAQNQAPDSLSSMHKRIDAQTSLEEIQKTLGGIKPQIKEVRPEVIQELKKHAESSKTPDSMKLVEKLDKKANNFFLAGRYNDALTAWQNAYGKSIEMKFSEGQGRALTGMCKVYVTQGKWVKARHLGENAVEVLAAVNDPVSLGKARVALAQAYFGLDNPAWATRQLDEALKLLMSRADQEPLEAAQMLELAGTLLFKYGKPLEGTRFFQQSIKYLEQGDRKESALFMRTQLITTMTELGWYVAAGEEAQKSVDLAKRINDPRALITALSSLGNTQFVLGEYQFAKDSYEHAFKITRSLPAKKQISKEGRAFLMMGFAFSLAACGESDRAKQMFKNLIPYMEKEGKYYEQAELANALGVLECRDNNVYKAVPLFSKALDIQAMLSPERPRLKMYILRNMAAAEFRIGKYRDAYTHMKNVSKMFNQKNIGKEYGLPKTRTYVALAESAMKMNDMKVARAFVDASIKLGNRFKDDATLWRAYTLDAQLLLSERKVDEAKESLKHALSHFRSPQAGYFPSPENLRYLSSRRDFGMQLVALTASQGMTEQALLVAEQLKEESVINSWLVRKDVSLKPKDRDIYMDLMKIRAHLHAAEQTTSPQKLGKEWSSWLTRFGAVARENRSLARLIAPYPTDIPEVIKTVRKKKVTVVEYLVGNKSSVAFTVDPKGRISATVLPVDRSKLKDQISLMLNAAKMGDEKIYQPNLRALHDELLPKSVKNFLPLSAEEQIVIIPDDILYNLPFAALIDENDKYLVENHLLTLTPSMRDLLDTGMNQTPATLSVLVASGENPQDRSETNQISNVVHPQPISTLGKKDLESLEEAVKDKSVLHFATTLPFADNNPTAVAIPFIISEGVDKDQKATAGSLFGLNIPSDLVVFSGTSVNGKKLQGKAVQMVSRGLNYAGAKNVMMSLWNTEPNEKISELVNFYRHKKQGMNSARSLRQAQLLSMSRNRSPRTWASFQLLGVGM